MAKMKDVGVKRKDKGIPVETSKMDYPDLYLDNKQLPDISKVNVGDKITIQAQAKVTSVSENQQEGEKPKRNVTLAIKKMGIDKGIGSRIQNRMKADGDDLRKHRKKNALYS